jgi:hypothetical protein
MSLDSHFEQLSTSREAGNVCSSYFNGRKPYTGLRPAWLNFVCTASPNTGGPINIAARRSPHPSANRSAPSRSRHGGPGPSPLVAA